MEETERIQSALLLDVIGAAARALDSVHNNYYIIIIMMANRYI